MYTSSYAYIHTVTFSCIEQYLCLNPTASSPGHKHTHSDNLAVTLYRAVI